MKKAHKLNQQERKEFIIISEYLSATDPETVALGIGMLKSYYGEQNIYSKIQYDTVRGNKTCHYSSLNDLLTVFGYYRYYPLVAIIIKRGIQRFIKYVLINNEYYYDHAETDINRT